MSRLWSSTNQRPSLSPPARNWIPSFQAFLPSSSLLHSFLLVYNLSLSGGSDTVVLRRLRTTLFSRGLSTSCLFVLFFRSTFGFLCVDTTRLEDNKVALKGVSMSFEYECFRGDARHGVVGSSGAFCWAELSFKFIINKSWWRFSKLSNVRLPLLLMLFFLLLLLSATCFPSSTCCCPSVVGVPPRVRQKYCVHVWTWTEHLFIHWFHFGQHNFGAVPLHTAPLCVRVCACVCMRTHLRNVEREEEEEKHAAEFLFIYC